MSRVQRENLFFGFSTIDRFPDEVEIRDIEVIRRDLYNHFFTRKGERLMRPNFGSIIWDKLFEPLTEGNIAEIIEDTRQIVTNDPRTEFLDMRIEEFDYGIRIEVDLLYLPFDTRAQLAATFDRRLREKG